MDLICVCRRLLPCVALLLIQAEKCFAENPTQPAGQANWPQKVIVTMGDVRTRIHGPKMWTLSGIDFRGAVMATEDSAYGSVLTIRNVGHLGTAHFLDVPGQPGAVEKENVTSLRLFVDDKPVSELMPMINLSGQSFRMERRSKIRAMNLETSISLRDGVLIETVNFLATGPIGPEKVSGTNGTVVIVKMTLLARFCENYMRLDKHGSPSQGTSLPQHPIVTVPFVSGTVSVKCRYLVPDTFSLFRLAARSTSIVASSVERSRRRRLANRSCISGKTRRGGEIATFTTFPQCGLAKPLSPRQLLPTFRC